jgi:hypothetical protein
VAESEPREAARPGASKIDNPFTDLEPPSWVEN